MPGPPPRKSSTGFDLLFPVMSSPISVPSTSINIFSEMLSGITVPLSSLMVFYIFDRRKENGGRAKDTAAHDRE